MKYTAHLTIVLFISFSFVSCFTVHRKGRNLSFPNILRNYFTHYPVFKRKQNVPTKQNPGNNRKFPYEFVPPTQIIPQDKPKSRLSNNRKMITKFVQNPFAEAGSNLHFIQHRGTDFMQSYRNAIPSVESVGSYVNDKSKKSLRNMVLNVQDNSKSRLKQVPVVVPKKMPAVTRNENRKGSPWTSWEHNTGGGGGGYLPMTQRDDYKVSGLTLTIYVNICSK